MDLGTVLICLTVVVVAALMHDFGRRWLNRQDQAQELTVLRQELTAENVKLQKAITNLVAQTNESIQTLEKKQNMLLSGGMLRAPARSRV